MKNWYIRNNDEHLGPYSLEELKLVGLYNDDFVWQEGLHQWTKAETVAELKNMVIFLDKSNRSGTPSIQQETNNKVKTKEVTTSWLKRCAAAFNKAISRFIKKPGEYTSSIL
ncbi:MAG: DUF4339 domain-containing protein [Candidatus Dadabacteria bacterium]